MADPATDAKKRKWDEPDAAPAVVPPAASSAPPRAPLVRAPVLPPAAPAAPMVAPAPSAAPRVLGGTTSVTAQAMLEKLRAVRRG